MFLHCSGLGSCQSRFMHAIRMTFTNATQCNATVPLSQWQLIPLHLLRLLSGLHLGLSTSPHSLQQCEFLSMQNTRISTVSILLHFVAEYFVGCIRKQYLTYLILSYISFSHHVCLYAPDKALTTTSPVSRQKASRHLEARQASMVHSAQALLLELSGKPSLPQKIYQRLQD